MQRRHKNVTIRGEHSAEWNMATLGIRPVQPTRLLLVRTIEAALDDSGAMIRAPAKNARVDW